MSGSALNFGGTHPFRLVLDAAPVAAWICDGRTILYSNPALAEFLGEPASSLAGRPVSDLLPADSYAGFRLRMDRLLAGHTVRRWEHELRHGGRGAVTVEVDSALIAYDTGPAVLTFFHDITDRRRAELALRSSEVRYRRIVDSEVVGVFEFRAAGITDANDAFLKLLGRTGADLREGCLPWRSVSPPEDEELDRRKLARLLTTGECPPFEKELLRADGVRVPVLLGAALIDPEPSWCALALVIDLTDRRKLQEIEQEKVRLEAVGVLAAGMAHNLNNILTGVMGNASMLTDGKLLPAGSRALDVATEIFCAGERAAALTARLLAYAGRGRIAQVNLDLHRIVEQELVRVHAQIPPGLRITTGLAADLPQVAGDVKQFTQMVRALLENAVEAVSGRDGGAIEVGTRVERVEDGAVFSRVGEPLPRGPYCLLEVRDNGGGMDTNTLAHAFDPFFSTKFPGRGLGLAAVSGIVGSARGAVLVSSSPGLGSLFQVYLPAAS